MLVQSRSNTAECGWFGKSTEEKRFEAELAAAKAKAEEASAKSALFSVLPANVDPNDFRVVIGEHVNQALATGVPTEISYGMVAGWTAGFALKKIGKVIAVAVGAVFIGLQTLAYQGFITLHHTAIERKFKEMCDMNSDGKVDTDDAMVLADQVKEILGASLPAGGGFGVGLLAGFRHG